jgi:glycogen(starch) synthase
VKAVVISNFYPPHHVSGYALLCSDVVRGLEARGHEVTVLTSTLGVDRETVEGRVHRVLTLESPLDFYRPAKALVYPAASRRNVRHVRETVSAVQPDVIFIWGLWNVSKRVAAEAERLLGARVAYYLANPWPIEANRHRAYWSLPARRRSREPLKRVCRLAARVWLHAEWREPALQFPHAPCCSQALRGQLIAAGVPLNDAPVIYEGIDPQSYVEEGNRREMPVAGGPFTLLYVGLLVEHKGVHTLVEALERLPPATSSRVSLTILGSGHPDYESSLRSLVTQTGLEDRVTFVGPIPRHELPAFLARHHVVVLPSIWEEPLALIMQESLASGAVFVGSATGGTTEIINDGENGLLFPPGDAGRLAEHITRLAGDPSLCRRLAARGRETAQQSFALTRMVDDLETYLRTVGGAKRDGGPA